MQMKFKNAFTLAEILIVLMVIGALATMTVPSLMKGVTEAQYKTAYRKALNAMVNLTTMEKLSGNLPSKATTTNADKLFDILNSSLSVKGYALSNGENSSLGSGNTITTSQMVTTLPNPNQSGRYWYWIITEDNLAYLIKKGNGTDNNDTTGVCATKTQILASQDTNGAGAAANEICFTIYVDVNGLFAGPNIAYKGNDNQVNAEAKIPAITNDQFPIYVGLDGATPGSQKVTITGRIAADLK